ncbi:MAG: RIP metalloprotease RseP [Candidatus Krumholzibacteriia bacterium]
MTLDNAAYYIAAFVISLGLVIIVHELGHFLFCKLFGVYVKTFSIGFGPKILRKRLGETEYALSLIPFGGYVKMAGEGMMEEIQDTGIWDERKYPLGTEEGNREAAAQDRHIPPERHFVNKSPYQRLLVFLAGPLFNLLLAFLLYVGVAWSQGVRVQPLAPVGEVVPGSSAAEAGLLPGDEIVSVDGEPVGSWTDVIVGLLSAEPEPVADVAPVPLTVRRDGEHVQLRLPRPTGPEVGRWDPGIRLEDTVLGLVQRGGPGARLGLQRGDRILSVAGEEVRSFEGLAGIVREHGGQEITVTWERDGRVMSGLVTPDVVTTPPDTGQGRLAVERNFLRRDVSMGEAIGLGARSLWLTTSAIVRGLYNLVAGGLGLEAIGGPIRIAQMAGEMLRWSFDYLVAFIAFFSVNLFLLNLLPIPVLDGGHVMFLLYELVRGKPAPERLQAIATQMGLIFLLLFMTFVVVLELWKVTGH